MTALATDRTIHSPWLGDIAVNAECELYFPGGLPGFEDHHLMAPIEIPSHRPLVYLQSLERDDLCFVSLPVYVIDPAFQLHLGEDDRAMLCLPDGCEPAIGSDVLCLVLLRKSGPVVEANPAAAVIINLHNRRGVQCVPPIGDTAAICRLGSDGRWRRVC